ncbi:hypothetical protein SAMN05444166_0705 [Singulisphaera sp. GP187]|uniref:hypothetical protein n=1 Tax=Singulisphaera sp. GP187 TaxID=1882752 RepID=UPI00092B0D40|nr:hypothetical protein [Singulisphaera sp. GP187]SIN76325.1 hypothetical protein SAMN05444166_0705 [Singulisphaera sp. GP187]
MQLRQIGFLVVAFTTAYIAAGAVSNLLPAESRALVLLCLITMFSMIGSAFSRSQPRKMITAVVAATVLAMFAINCWRRWFDPMAAVGPVPRSLEAVALVVLSVINIAAAALVAAVFSAGCRVFRFRWVVFGVTGTVLVAFCMWVARRVEGVNSRQALLRRVVMLEQSSGRIGWGERQELSTTLAVLGRQREAREIPLLPEAVGQKPSDTPDTPDLVQPFVVTPWRDAMTRIAAEHRLVLIMEAHTVTEDRAWIEQTLGLFRAAGFTHYFAEAIAESGSTLKSRGYPTSRTGFYTLDPRFGNLVRTALRLGFEVGGYDLADGDFGRREEYQAATLAQQFAARPDIRMVVHAGHGHVFKHEVYNVGRYMAARLWKMTGDEPFTIWQLSNELPNDVYRHLVRRIGPITEPVMLVPPPRNVTETLFPESSVQPAVDAIVIHPPRLGQEPMDRHGAFTDQMTRVPGVWLGNQWPVVIAAIPDEEPDNAIALDQIMLRRGETGFELWLPHVDCTIRVWSLDGPLSVNANIKTTPVRVNRSH